MVVAKPPVVSAADWKEALARTNEQEEAVAAEIDRLRDRDLLRKNMKARGKQWASLISIVVVMISSIVVLVRYL